MDKLALRKRRQGRIRSQIKGSEARPRLAVFKSNKSLYAQVIDDVNGKTLAAIDTRASKAKTPIEKAKESGVTLAKDISAKGIKEVVFDRGGFRYTGGVKALADALRAGGIKV
jgi:large subunit ribosomal protein L18